ncbi:M14 family metallocarboxypeptidase [Bradyrhizobium sp. UFLA05-109]
MFFRRYVRGTFAGAVFLASSAMSLAGFNPASVYQEAPEVAVRYPDAEVHYTTPAFAPGKQDFTSHNELMAFLETLAAKSPNMRMKIDARSQQGRVLPVLFFSRDQNALGNGAKPVVLIIGQQHGNEPAGGEAALVLAQRLGTGDLADLLSAIDVIIVPRANPDGAEAFVRGLANGMDANRDHTLLRTPEIQTIGALFNQFHPQLVLDCHEFTVGGRWIEKVGGVQRIDAMIQYATVPNLPPSLEKAESQLFLPAILQAFDTHGLTHDWYHTTDGSRRDSPIAMGGIGPDTGRNVAGLRNAVSFLLETRGVGLGRAHLARRVETHVVAAEAILQLAAKDPGAFMQLSKQASIEATTSDKPVVVVAHGHHESREMVFVDPKTGADKPVTVTWVSALKIDPALTRPRPAGYLVSRDNTQAIDAIKRAGLTFQIVANAAVVPGEHYRVTDVTSGAKEDVRGDDTGAGAIIKGTFALEKADIVLTPDDVFIPFNQPLSGLAVALLEPESDAGLVANKFVPATNGQVLSISRLDRAP